MITTMYHVTTQENQDSISRLGINPQFSKGRRASCYFVEESMIQWAILHTSQRHGVHVDRLIVYPVRVERAAMTKTGMAGVWRTQAVIIPETQQPADAFITFDPEDEF